MRRARSTHPIRTSSPGPARPAAPPNIDLHLPPPATPPNAIRTPRLVLRLPIAADSTAYLDALAASRGELRRWFPIWTPGERDADYVRRQIARAAEAHRTGAAWRRAAFDTAGQLVGVVNLVSIERGLCWQADMNWWVRSDRTGQGFATEMVRAALAHALADMPESLGLSSVHAGIHPENAASRRVAEKCGFARDGSLISKLLVNGTWQTHEAFRASA